jgi:bifunctional DNase/RNase
MEISAELSKVIINEAQEQQIVVIKEKGGQRSFPIVIGIVEIAAIDRNLKGFKMPRPMTHNLLGSVIEELGGKLEKIVITDLKMHTYFAQLHISCNGDTKIIDCRPSDAIALSVLLNAPIFVQEQVFVKASM